VVSRVGPGSDITRLLDTQAPPVRSIHRCSRRYSPVAPTPARSTRNPWLRGHPAARCHDVDSEPGPPLAALCHRNEAPVTKRQERRDPDHEADDPAEEAVETGAADGSSSPVGPRGKERCAPSYHQVFAFTSWPSSCSGTSTSRSAAGDQQPDDRHPAATTPAISPPVRSLPGSTIRRPLPRSPRPVTGVRRALRFACLYGARLCGIRTLLPPGCREGLP
jgi:hypothetical protein